MSKDAKPKPYRIDWRGSEVVHWTLDHEVDSHAEAIEHCDLAVRQNGGFARVIVQHVIHSAKAPAKPPSRSRAGASR